MSESGTATAISSDLAQMKELARALSDIERGGEGSAPVGRKPGSVLGIVGPPGVGKSSLISELVGLCRQRGERVVVLCVDPSSPLTGGALLGDRIRLSRHATDLGVFVRSFASRGHPGGLAAAVPAAADTALALGWDRVFVEPVGGGQNDIDVAACADRVVLVVSPESGDDIQALKSGILEIADVVAVNKSDRPGAAAIVRIIAMQLGRIAGRVVLVSAIRQEGIEELDQHLLGEFEIRADRREAAQISAILNDCILEVRSSLADDALREEVLGLLAVGHRRTAVSRLLESTRRGQH